MDVQITEETVILQADGSVRVSRFIVTTSSGFRAVLPACMRDECAAGYLIPCTRPNNHITTVPAWLRHCETHCHGWHRERVEAFAESVARPQRARQKPLPGVTPYLRQQPVGSWYGSLAECPSWPVVEDRLTQWPAPCDCETCVATADRFGSRR